MTAKQPVNDWQEGDNSGSDRRKSEENFSPQVPVNEEKIGGKKFSPVDCRKPKMCGSATELETDQESIGSSEEMESPRSVTRWTPKKIVYVHSQILRIREEDSHLGEDIGEGLSAKDNPPSASGQQRRLVSSHVDVVLFSRPILPASPLGGKTAIKTLH